MAAAWWNFFRRGAGTRTVDQLRGRIERFRDLVANNNLVLEHIADAGEKLGGEYIFDSQYLRALARELAGAVRRVVDDLQDMTGDRYPVLHERLRTIDEGIQAALDVRAVVPRAELTLPIESIDLASADVMGEKMARLGELRRRLDCRVPDGFVISAHAGQEFLRAAGIDSVVEEYGGPDGAGPDEAALEQVAMRLRELILTAPLPRSLARAIRTETQRLDRRCGCKRLAVRSSAIGEDGEFSFAGQYRTILGVPPDGLPAAYKEVMASLYSVGVMRYRLRGEQHPCRGAMAVGCLAMVGASASGVAYTLDPSRPQEEVLLVAATPGLGKVVVEGSGVVDRFVVSRSSPHAVQERSIGWKETAYDVAPERGIRSAPIAENERGAPAVTDLQLCDIVTMALRIERYMKCAQDIEWAVDEAGRVITLQCRPLRLPPHHRAPERDMTGVVGRYPVLLRNQGTVACRGIAAGRVHIVSDEENPGELPDDVVLVARTSTPQLAAALATARAPITDIGTPTGHLAAIAREFRVPTIVDTETATRVLRDSDVVTVDAEENVVYQGTVTELLRYQLLESSSYEDSPEFRLLRKMLTRIAPLNLRDPQSPDFTPGRCSMV